ncbi:nitroimidazole resistance protein [Brachyspira hampsonii 30446]|uniref:Nitroimidazole resistance protein n=2 Tax=Brachyspira hampsonii TaxID=1287055 RepID=A0A2U4F535_9SPIR|nr:pyridoxamine 5'-phosphate oxidase family protein [Brachyspira hampsonii]EKV56070.1 nitroimidazole resistance protein [Brachyspira hampsonii 30446]
MIRKKQQLSYNQNIEVLDKCSSGVLAVIGDDDYPYAVPLSYVYYDNKIFFHASKIGHKLDSIKNNNKVSFCVIEKDDVKPKEYTTYYRSVIVFGRAFISEDEKEKRDAIEKLALKYYPNDIKSNRDNIINREYNALCIIKLNIEFMTGKEAIELVNNEEE